MNKPFMMPLFRTCLLACLSLSFAGACVALENDRNQPIEIRADQFSGDEVKQVATYSGNVAVSQGSLTITGNQLKLRVTPKGYREATISGGPAKFRQKRDPNPKNPGVTEWIRAEANAIVYSEENDTITLTGRAKLYRTENGQQKDSTQGERIVYDMRNARSVIDGGVVNGQRQRVTTIIAPRTKQTIELDKESTSLSNANSLNESKRP